MEKATTTTPVNYKKIAFWGVAAALVSGIAFYFIRQAELVQKTCFNFKSAIIVKLGLAQTILKLNLELKNKSDIPFDVTDLNLLVFVNGIQVSKITSIAPLHLPGHGAKLFPLVVEFSPKNTIKSALSLANILAMATNPGSVVFNFKGEMGVRSSFIMLSSLPIDITQTWKELTSPSAEKC